MSKEHQIDTSKLDKGQLFQLMLVLISSTLRKCGYEEEFILVVRGDGKWQTHTTIQDQEQMHDLLRRLGATPASSREDLHLDISDFVTDGSMERVKQ